jgi:hypothetical protein
MVKSCILAMLDSIKITSDIFAALHIIFHSCFILLVLLEELTYSSTLKMEATCSSETSVDYQRTTRSYIPEDRTLYLHVVSNLINYIFTSFIIFCF